MVFLHIQASGNAREIPNGIHSSLVDIQLPFLIHKNLAIDLQATTLDLGLQLWDDHVRASDGDRGANIHTLLNLSFVMFACKMAKWVKGHYLRGVGPLRLLFDRDRWLGVFIVGFVLYI